MSNNSIASFHVIGVQLLVDKCSARTQVIMYAHDGSNIVAWGTVKASFMDATATLFTPLTDNPLAMFLPFFSAYPQLMESAQARQDAASQPSTIPPFDGISRRVYFHVREVTRELRFKSICETGKQAPSPGEDDVSHKDLTQVWVAGTQRL